MRESTAPAALVVGPDAGQALWFGPNRTRVLASAGDTDGAYGLLHSWVPEGSSPPLHVHHADDEAFYVIKGRLRIVCGDTEHIAPAGSFALLPRGVPHTFIAEGGGDVQVLTLISPGGGERYFADAGAPAGGPGLPPAGPPDVARLSAAGPAHGIEILGPPLHVSSSSSGAADR